MAISGARSGVPRMLMSTNGGDDWTSSEIKPIHTGASTEQGATSGVFSIAFDADGRGVAVGGDYADPQRSEGHIALTDDWGAHWYRPEGKATRGYRSAVVCIDCGQSTMWVATGPTGTDWSADRNDWQSLSEIGFHALSTAEDDRSLSNEPSVDRADVGVANRSNNGPTLWGCGSDGRVAKIDANTWMGLASESSGR
jgi:hypothetical protein